MGQQLGKELGLASAGMSSAIRSIFARYDLDKNGFLDPAEGASFLSDMLAYFEKEQLAYLKTRGAPKGEVRQWKSRFKFAASNLGPLFVYIDVDGNGKISRDEFSEFFLQHSKRHTFARLIMELEERRKGEVIKMVVRTKSGSRRNSLVHSPASQASSPAASPSLGRRPPPPSYTPEAPSGAEAKEEQEEEEEEEQEEEEEEQQQQQQQQQQSETSDEEEEEAADSQEEEEEELEVVTSDVEEEDGVVWKDESYNPFK